MPRTPLNWAADHVDRVLARWRGSTASDTLSLSAVRILFGLLLLLVGWPRYALLAGLPDALYQPPLLSMAALFGGFPPAWLLHGLDATVLLTLVTLTLGFRTRLSTIALLCTLLLGNSFRFSLGKIDHDIMPIAFLFAMCFRDWGRHLSVDALLRTAPRPVERTDLLLPGVFLAFGFFSAGFGKAMNWVDLDPGTGGTLGWLHNGFHVLGRNKLLAPQAMALDEPWLWELADLLAVAFELGGFVALFHRRAWYLWLLAAALFHASVLLLLNISFIVHVPVYLAFLPWSLWLPRAAERSRSFVLSVALVLLAFLLLHWARPAYENSVLLSLLDVIRAPTALPYLHLAIYGLVAIGAAWAWANDERAAKQNGVTLPEHPA